MERGRTTVWVEGGRWGWSERGREGGEHKQGSKKTEKLEEDSS